MTKGERVAAQADAVIAIGILEALTDAEAVRLCKRPSAPWPMTGVFYSRELCSNSSDPLGPWNGSGFPSGIPLSG